MESLGRFLIFAGVAILVLGLVLLLAPKIPLIGKLPGDIHIQTDKFQFYFPLATSLIVSLLLTIIINIVVRLFGK